MPSVSGDQQRFMQGAFERLQAGTPRATDPKMSAKKLLDFTRKVPGAPERKNPRPHYGSRPVTEET